MPAFQANTPALAFGSLAGRAIGALGRASEPLVHAAGVPARAVNAIGTNLAGTAAPLDVSDVALYGYDVNTGRTPSSYGEALAGELESAGEITPGGIASKLIRVAGDIVSDPAMAPLLLSGAEAAGALAGRMGPAMPGPRAPRMPPQGRLQPAYPGQARGRGPGGGTVVQPRGPGGGPVAPRAAAPPTRFNPTATQEVGLQTQPVQTIPPVAKKPPRPKTVRPKPKLKED